MEEHIIKAIVLYYSYSGNTRGIAEFIQKELNCDIAEIDPVKPYSNVFNEVVNSSKIELESGPLPDIKPLGVDLSSYDTIILGTPVWWYTAASPIMTLIKSADFSGKKVYPFTTHEGWPGRTLKDYTKECTGAFVCKGLEIRFKNKKMSISETDLKQWIEGIE